MALSIQDRLEQAETALHRLEIGQLASKVTLPDGSSTEFKSANINELRAYVDDLRAKLGHTRSRDVGAINVIF